MKTALIFFTLAFASRSSIGDVVVIGDVHGCLSSLQHTLIENSVTNKHNEWIAGNTTVVQMGDLLDRGMDDLEVIRFVQKMEQQAEAAGGKWVQLIGNHELMNLQGDFRYADDRTKFWNETEGQWQRAGFQSREKREKAMMGEVGEWLRKLPVIYQWRDVVFVHADLSDPAIARRGIAGINDHAHGYLNGEHSDASVIMPLIWERNLASMPESQVCGMLDESLAALGATKIVLGHTITAMEGHTPGCVATRCSGRIIMSDVGMSSFYDNIPKLHDAIHISSTASADGDARTTVAQHAQAQCSTF